MGLLNIFRDTTDEPEWDDGIRRPLLGGVFTQHLKHEDRTALYECQKGDETLSFAMVADGHGGPYTSQWLAENLLQMIDKEAADGSKEALHASCKKCFLAAHEEVKTILTKDGILNNAGSTCVVLIFNHKRREVTCANVGDSDAILAHANGHVELSTSHRLQDSKEEQARLKAIDGVKLGRALDAEGWPGGPLRAWPGGLAVTRGIGDADCEAFVIPEPSCNTVLAPEGGCVVLCCSDGVWDMVTLPEAAKLLCSTKFHSPTAAAKMITKRSIAKCGIFDDTSASLLFIDAADAKAATSFVTERLKASRLWKYRPQGGYSKDDKVAEEEKGDANADASDHDGTFFVELDDNGKKGGPWKDPKSGRRMSHKADAGSVGEGLTKASLPTFAAHDDFEDVPEGATAGGNGEDANVNMDDLAKRYGADMKGIAPELLAQAQNAAKAGAAGRARRGSTAAGRQQRRLSVFSGKITGSATSLDPDEVALWTNADQSNIVNWESLDMENMQYLGQGEFAKAFSTFLDGKPCAVKVLKEEKHEITAAVKGLKREIMIMSMMNHEHILSVVAIGHQAQSVPFAVLEKLETVLNKQLPADADTVPFWVAAKEKKAWNTGRSIAIAVQLAEALKYCHDDALPGYRVLHRDIKPNNIGFMPANEGETDGRLVIFDFGLTCLWKKNAAWSTENKPERDEMRALTGECGSLRYMAPEVCNSREYNHLSEVFSFATVLWEMCAKQRPFIPIAIGEEHFKSEIDKGFRPALEKAWPADLKALLTDCWAQDPTKRPEFEDIVPRLKALKDITPAVPDSGGCCSIA